MEIISWRVINGSLTKGMLDFNILNSIQVRATRLMGGPPVGYLLEVRHEDQPVKAYKDNKHGQYKSKMT